MKLRKLKRDGLDKIYLGKYLGIYLGTNDIKIFF